MPGRPATGLPVVTTARAMVSALQHRSRQARRVVTPYQDSVNAQLTAFLEHGGIEVVRLETLRAADVAALGRITAEHVRALARTTMSGDCDALFIGCSQLSDPQRSSTISRASSIAQPGLPSAPPPGMRCEFR